MMRFLIIAALAVGAWYLITQVDYNKAKNQSLHEMQNEKTVTRVMGERQKRNKKAGDLMNGEW